MIPNDCSQGAGAKEPVGGDVEVIDSDRYPLPFSYDLLALFRRRMPPCLPHQLPNANPISLRLEDDNGEDKTHCSSSMFNPSKIQSVLGFPSAPKLREEKSSCITAAVIAFRLWDVFILDCITSMAFGECDRAASASSMVALHTSMESGGAAFVSALKASRASDIFSTALRCLRMMAFTGVDY